MKESPTACLDEPRKIPVPKVKLGGGGGGGGPKFAFPFAVLPSL